MIDAKRKNKLLKDIEKNGNVLRACLRVGIDKSSYYRWKKEDPDFAKLAIQAEKMGQDNMSDIAEGVLMNNVKKGNQRAIEFVLRNNRQKYRAPHDIRPVEKPDVKPKMTDIFNAIIEFEKSTALMEKYEAMEGLPPKPDGTKITIDDVLDYKDYIDKWYRRKLVDNPNYKFRVD